MYFNIVGFYSAHKMTLQCLWHPAMMVFHLVGCVVAYTVIISPAMV